MLCVENFSVRFRRYHGALHRSSLSTLSDVNLEISRGQLLAVVGESGGGKSLVAHALVGLLPPNAIEGGAILLDGKQLDQEARRRLRGRKIGLVPQSIAALDPTMTVERQVVLAARRTGHDSAAAQRMALDALDRYGLDRIACQCRPHQLSGGMARRVLLAIATVADPDLVILDEPTNGLDVDNAAFALRYARDLADSGKAVMVITHDLPAILPLADAVTIIRDGMTVESVPAAGLISKGEGLTTAYSRKLWAALPGNSFIAALEAPPC
jgi:peptide/nickel transport system ATP-binding protein